MIPSSKIQEAITAFNAVRFKVKIRARAGILNGRKKIHAEWSGLRPVNVIQIGDHTYRTIAEWDDMDKIAST